MTKWVVDAPEWKQLIVGTWYLKFNGGDVWIEYSDHVFWVNGDQAYESLEEAKYVGAQKLRYEVGADLLMGLN